MFLNYKKHQRQTKGSGLNKGCHYVHNSVHLTTYKGLRVIDLNQRSKPYVCHFCTWILFVFFFTEIKMNAYIQKSKVSVMHTPNFASTV